MNNKMFQNVPRKWWTTDPCTNVCRSRRTRKMRNTRNSLHWVSHSTHNAFLHFIYRYWHGPNTQCFDPHLLYVVIVWHPMLCFISFISVSLNIDNFSPFMVGASSRPHWKCFFYRFFVHLIPAVNHCFWF